MRTFLIFLSFTIAIPLFSQTTIHVPFDYPTIQGGLNAASEGDTVSVAPATYYENIIWPETNGIQLISTGDSSNTIIDGGGINSVIYMNPQAAMIDTSTLIQGFKIRNGGNVEYGGGIFCNNSHPKLNFLSISNNTTLPLGAGGGMYLLESNPILTNINFTHNSAKYDGGGIYIFKSNPTLINVSFSHNSADYYGGGGIYIRNSNPSLLHVRLFQNSAIGPGGRGGGLHLVGASKSKFTDVIIYENIATDGGGMYLDSSYPCEQLSILNNIAKRGGGIFVNWGNPIIKFSNLLNNSCFELGSSVYIDNGDIIIDSCNIINDGYSIFNGNQANYITAVNNWFGEPSGPFHPTQNPTGLGDSTNQFVNVTPWLTEPNIDAPPIPVQNVTVISTTDTEISLSWDKSLIGDLAGYKVYYDPDSTYWEFDNPIDVGLDTNYTLSNLNVGQTYYVSVTCYDTDGNESWYSEVVSANTTPAPRILVEVEEINYGIVTVREESSFMLDITNSGTETLTIFNSQTSTNKFYTHQLIELNIEPNSTSQLSVYFKPIDIIEYTDVLTLNSNAANEPQLSIPLMGEGVYGESPVILSIEDVRNDQGGFIRIQFQRSRYDGVEGDSSIQTYSFWRKIPDSDEWDAVGLFNVILQPIYYYVAPTLGDSTKDGIFWSTFKVSAHPANPLIFFMSEPDSGYSIDNIAPEVPTGLLAAQLDLIHAVLLDWDENTEKDFSYYAIYKGSDENFEPDSTNILDTTTDTSFVDSDILIGTYHYKVSAFDYSGNESEFASTSIIVVGIDDISNIPTQYSLEQNYPNPFNPSTTIKYGLPTESNVKISIYSLLGEEIKVLFNGLQKPGFHNLEFDASNLSSGIYLYRISASSLETRKEFQNVKKMVLIK